MGGGIFVFSAKIRLETAYNRGILHTPQANGGAIAPLTTLLSQSKYCPKPFIILDELQAAYQTYSNGFQIQPNIQGWSYAVHQRIT